MKQLILIITSSLILASCAPSFMVGKKAALTINTTPIANVYLNDNHQGVTPLELNDLKPGEYTIRIQAQDNPNQEWQAKVNLNPQVVTVINRQFGDTPDESSYYIVQLEPLPDQNVTEIAIITLPDNVIVKLNDQPEGFSPINLKGNIPGDHQLNLIAPGYKEEYIGLKLVNGFKTIISAQLARTKALIEPEPLSATESAELAETPQENQEADLNTASLPDEATATLSARIKPYVEIKETGTGWLRVRSEPNANTDNEVAKVNVGEAFPFVQSNQTGWYQIEHAPGQKGWISARYAQLHR
jgi:hypothetical protein